MIAEAVKLLEIPESIIEQAIESELLAGNLVREQAEEDLWLYLAHLYQAEVELSKTLRNLSLGVHPLPSLDTAGITQSS